MELTFEANADRLTKEHNDRAWLAWHTAALSRASGKKFPELSKLQIKNNIARSKQMDRQLQGLQKWVAATGGKVVVKPR